MSTVYLYTDRRVGDHHGITWYEGLFGPLRVSHLEDGRLTRVEGENAPLGLVEAGYRTARNMLHPDGPARVLGTVGDRGFNVRLDPDRNALMIRSAEWSYSLPRKWTRPGHLTRSDGSRLHRLPNVWQSFTGRSKLRWARDDITPVEVVLSVLLDASTLRLLAQRRMWVSEELFVPLGLGDD